MANYELHNFDRKGVFYNEALTDMDNAIKELAEGGSDGGLQFEQVGTTHTRPYFIEGQGSPISVTYYNIPNTNICALKISITGAPALLNKDQLGTCIDDKPNVVPLGDGFITTGAVFNNINRGYFVHLTNKLYIPVYEDDMKIQLMNCFSIFLGTPVENPT